VKHTRVVIDRWDDIDLAGGREVKADDSLSLGLDGVTVELDLTAERAKKLREYLAPFLAAGAKPPGEVGADLAHQKVSRKYAAAMRAWADTQEPPMQYRTPSGGHYYGVKLRRAFAAHLAATGEVIE